MTKTPYWPYSTARTDHRISVPSPTKQRRLLTYRNLLRGAQKASSDTQKKSNEQNFCNNKRVRATDRYTPLRPHCAGMYRRLAHPGGMSNKRLL